MVPCPDGCRGIVPRRRRRESGPSCMLRSTVERLATGAFPWRTLRMTIDANKALVRRFIDEVFVQGRPEAVDELVADGFVSHTWRSTDDGRGDLKRAIARLSTVLADVRFTVEDVIAEDDRVAVRVTAEATQVGAFMGLPPSGKGYSIGEIHIFRVRDGRLAEHWHQYDQLGMMRQLGALPG